MLLFAVSCVAAPDAPTASTPAQPQRVERGSVAIEVESYDFWYKPKRLSIAPGSDVEVKLENEGKVPHTFSVPAAGFEIRAAGGHDREGTFSAPSQVGWMGWFCRYSDHMKGRIFVGGGGVRSEQMGALSPIDFAAEKAFKKVIGAFSGYGYEFDPADCTSLVCYRREARGY
jgi:plastocyanin